MAEKLSALVKDPGGRPRHVWISNRLEALQKEVGGYIETVTLTTDLVLICNEEGRLRQLPYNVTFCGMDLVGTIILCGVDGEEFADLPCDWQQLKKLFPELWADGAQIARATDAGDTDSNGPQALGMTEKKAAADAGTSTTAKGRKKDTLPSNNITL